MSTLLIVALGLSLAIAVGMSWLAWRVVREDRRRSDARVQALSAAIADPSAGDTAAAGNADAEPDVAPAFADEAWAAPKVALVAGVFIAMVGVGAVAVALIGERDPVTSQTPAAPAGAPAAAGNGHDLRPIALVSLTHERVGQGLTVRGTVRIDAPQAPALTAVVFGFDADGSFLTSARSEVRLLPAPGERASFTVALPRGDEISRYRVSFRAGDDVVPHIDERS